MIKHVVCFKIKEEYQNHLMEAKLKMLAMKEQIPYIIDLEVGLDVLHSERSFDLILEVILPDLSALERYQQDPYHCNVVKTLMHQIREASIAVDYEMDEVKE